MATITQTSDFIGEYKINKSCFDDLELFIEKYEPWLKVGTLVVVRQFFGRARHFSSSPWVVVSTSVTGIARTSHTANFASVVACQTRRFVSSNLERGRTLSFQLLCTGCPMWCSGCVMSFRICGIFI